MPPVLDGWRALGFHGSRTRNGSAPVAAAIRAAEWCPETRELVLWRGVGDLWTAAVIARGIKESEPNWGVIRFDSRGEPVVAVGRLEEPYGWFRVFRRKP